MGGWLDQMEIRLNSASVEVEVKVEAELGKKCDKNVEVKFLTVLNIFVIMLSSVPVLSRSGGWLGGWVGV